MLDHLKILQPGLDLWYLPHGLWNRMKSFGDVAYVSTETLMSELLLPSA